MPLILCLFILIFGSLEARELDLVIHQNPHSLCRGAFTELARRVESFQPKGYKDPKNVEPRPDLATYRKLIPSSLFVEDGSPRVEIAPVAEIPDTFLIIASERELMNYLLKRASFWIEGNRQVATDEEFFNVPNLVISAGHDLQGRDLKAYHDLFMNAHTQSALPEDPTLRTRAQVERKFWREFVVPLFEKYEKEGREFVLISSPAGKEMTEAIAGHEILHARYFLDPEYRKACDDYWKEVPRPHKLIFYGALHSYDLIETDQTLASNEFQAYILQPGAQEVRTSRLYEMRALSPLVTIHRKKLNLFLQSRGIKPLKFSLKW